MKKNNPSGFTLVELLIAVVILGVLTTVAMGSFKISQMRGRDARRKSDLKQVANALELYYTDHSAYPNQGSLVWGSSFADSNTTYFQVLPSDTSSSQYLYVPSSSLQKYGLFAALENPKDQDISSDPNVVGRNCGLVKCNFVILSANASLEDLENE